MVNLHSFLTSAVTRSVWSALQTMKRQLVKQGNNSTMANWRTKLSAVFRAKFGNFSRNFKMLMYLHRDFSAESLTMFSGNLTGNH